MIVTALSPEKWATYSEKAHLICFDEKRDSKSERIDFALLTADDEKPLAYMTVRELDAMTVYLQYGGAFPETRGTANSFRAYMRMLIYLKEIGYETAGTYIENTNKTMLRFAMKAGWTITGIRTFKGAVMIEHQMNLKEINL